MTVRTPFLAATVAALTMSMTFPTTSPVTSADPRSAPSTQFDVSALETGAPPALAWSERRSRKTVVHGEGGTVTPVPNRISEFAPMGSGFVIQTLGGRPTSTRWIGTDGNPGRGTWRTGYGLAVSAHGKAAAFSGKRGKVWSIDSEGDRVLSFNRVPIQGKGRAVTVVGEDCSERTSNYGCAIFVNGGRGYYTSSHGIVDSAPRMRLVSTGRGRWLGGTTSISDTGTCSVMTRPRRAVWRTCANRFSDISPDNSHVIGLPAYGDGFGPMTIDVLKTVDGSVARAFTASRDGGSATYFDEVWEDAEHLLVVTYQDEEWAIVRLGLDGSMEYAVDPRSGTDLGMPFQLQAR